MNMLKVSSIFAALLVLAPQSAVAQASYVMTCRSGGNMQATAGVRGINPYVFVEIRFNRGTAGAAVRPPSPGECTWIDRAIGNGEPARILFVDTSAGSASTFCRAGDCRVSTTSQGTSKLMNLVKNSQPFQVRVYNDGAGNMRVTRIGP